MAQQNIEELVRLSGYAAVVAMLLSAVLFAAVGYGALRLGRAVRVRTRMNVVAAIVTAGALFAAYVVTLSVYVGLHSALEYRLTHVVQFCHLPGLLPRILPLIILPIVYVAFRMRTSSAAT